MTDLIEFDDWIDVYLYVRCQSVNGVAHIFKDICVEWMTILFLLHLPN